jgi:hypothetical protein
MEYREYRPGDEGILNDLYNEVFERERTIEEWRWEYLDTPEGQSIIVVVDLDGEVIAHEAMIPMRFHVFDEEYLGGKIEDAYIDLKHRGKKVFGPLTEYCLDLSRDRGYRITFGLTARPVNYRLHISRGYKDICSLNAYLGVFDPAAVTADVARVLKFSAPKRLAARAVMGVLAKRFERSTARYARVPDSYEIEHITRFDDRFDGLWRRFIGEHRVITIKRSSDFLNWRYVDNPYRDYGIFAAIVDGEPVGYLCAATVTREDMGLTLKVGVTSDFLVLPGYEAAFPSFLRRAVDYWRSSGADMTINWAHRGGIYSGAFVEELKRCGFVSTRGRYDIPVFVRTLGDDIKIDGFYDIDNWHVTQVFGGAWV